MLGFSSSSHEGRYYALFDIGSASVGVGIAKDSVYGAKLVWYKRVEYGYQGIDDYNRYVRTMYATLLEAGMKITSEGFKQVRNNNTSFSARNLDVVCILAQPWFLGSVQTQTINKEKRFHATKDTLVELQNNALSKSLEMPETSSWQELMGKPEVLEVYNDLVLLEGYPVKTYEHRMTNEFSAQFYFALVSESVQQHVEEVIGRVFPNHDLLFSTSTRVFSNIETKLSPTKKQRLTLIEITGEITSISILKKGVVTGILTVPFGTNHLLKAIAPKAVSAQEARSSLDVLSKDKTSIKLDSLSEGAQTAFAKWHIDVAEAMCVLSNGVTPPSNIVVAVDMPWYPLCKLALEESLEMPGIRKALDIKVRHVEPVPKDDKNKTKLPTLDTRLSTFTRLLNRCTSKKSMCYTEKNHNI